MITNLKNTISTKGSGGMSTGSGDYKYNYGGIVPGAEAQAQALIDANMKSMGVSASNPASARLATVPSAGSESASGALTAGAYGSLLADAEKTAAAERLASNDSVGGAAGDSQSTTGTVGGTGEVELLERIDPTVDVNYNRINELYAAQLQAALGGLEKQYDPLFGVIDTNRANTEADYYEAVRQATALAAREKQAMNEMFNAAGLNTGAAGQAQLAGSAVKQQNINAINIAEAKALAVLGKHSGYPFYTIGQRKGLGVALGYPAYVLKINAAKNTVMLGREEQLTAEYMLVEEPCWVGGVPQGLTVRVRYRSRPVPCEAPQPVGDGRYLVHLLQPVQAITPGQSAVFYTGNRVVGGAFIADQRGINQWIPKNDE